MSKQAKMNFLESLIAVVAGNLVYFLLMPHLPPVARHSPMHVDLGVVIDFWICLVFLGAIKTLRRHRGSSGEHHHQR